MVEGIEVQTQGTSVGLSGINADDLAEALSDVYMGAPALIWFALLAPGPQSGPVVIGTPYLMWSGNVGQPAINVGREEIGITLSLESGMVYLQRASNRRYTAADQAINYPNDSAFAHVEEEQDVALLWG
jgi:hypothetical protein